MNKKVLLGCGLAVALVLLAFVAVLVMFGSKVASFASEIIEESQERATWIAPAGDATGKTLFPVGFGNAHRQSFEQVSELAVINIRRKGEHGSYRTASGAAIEVFAWRVDQTEVADVFDSVGQAIDDGPYNTRMKFTFDQYSMRFSFSPPSTSGRLWFNKGWMFLFLTSDGIELEPLEKAYLEAINGAGAAIDGSQPLPEVEATDELAPF